MAAWPARTMPSGVVILCPEGRLDLMSAPRLRDQLHRVVQSGGSRIVVDLSRVDAIDSSGVGALISGLKAARQADGDLRLSTPGPQVVMVLQLTNLTDVLRSVDSAETAFDDA